MYKFVKVTSLYQKALTSWSNTEKRGAKLSYSEAMDSINYQAYGWSDFYESELGKFGVESTQIIANSDFHQQLWAQENQVDKSGLDLLIEQLKRLKPDVVLFEDSHTYGGKILEQIKIDVPSIKCTVGFNCAPCSPSALEGFKAFNFVLTCTLGFKVEMEKAGVNTYLINHAFHQPVLDRIQLSNTVEHDTVFVGGIFLGTDFHNRRRKLIENLINKAGSLTIYGYLNESISWKRKITNSIIPGHNYSRGLKRQIRTPKFGLEMYQVMRDSKIVLNNHIDAVKEYAGNMRLFEATGIGSCLLTDNKTNIRDLFDVGNEIVVYDSPADCVDKIRWLLDNEKEREEIAVAGQKRTLKEHTFKERAVQLHQLIIGVLGG